MQRYVTFAIKEISKFYDRFKDFVSIIFCIRLQHYSTCIVDTSRKP